ncbi:MAG: hypothetical protein HY898_10855 [Deltaproteobacteria bacterium]|nr:hypothetical protein [Deltaproteobacteria bacterium]
MRASSTTLLGLAALCMSLGLASGGCRQMMLDRQLESVRKASPAFMTLGDYEVARTIVYSSLGNYEGQHRLAPNNADGLFLLTRGWAAAGFNFMEDDWEASTDAGDDELAEENRTRARGAYTRAAFYGLELLEQKAQDFQLARRDARSVRTWLKSFEAIDADSLYWTGFAWMGRVNVSKDIPEISSESAIGVAMLERVVELDADWNHGLAHVALGAWHARSASGELDKAREHFERAMRINGGKLLITQVQFARTYYCVRNDKANYVRLLTNVVDAGDPLPDHRLSNTVAQRRAKRYLSDVRMADCGF